MTGTSPTPQGTSGYLPLILLFATGLFLALQTALAKLAAEAGAPLLSFLGVAILGAGGLLLLLSRPPKMTPALLVYAALSGGLFALPNALGFLAISRVGAGFIALVFAFTPLLTWLLAVLLRMEAPRPGRLFGVAVALSGALILALSKGAAAGAGNGFWIAVALGFPAILAIGNIFRTRYWPPGVPPVFLAAVMLLSGAIWILPVAWLTEGSALLHLPGVWTLLGVETAVFAVSFILYFQLQNRAGPVYLSQIGSVIAIVGSLIAVFALGEILPPLILPAGALIAAGTLVFHRANSAGRTKPETVRR